MINEKIRERRISSSLCRFRLADEDRVTDAEVKKTLALAFEELRCFSFYPDRNLVSLIKEGKEIHELQDKITPMQSVMFDEVASGDETQRSMLYNDMRLGARLVSAIGFFHRALAEADFPNIYDRRIVLVREKSGAPTIHHVSPESTVIAHVGQGPPWKEIPSIYLGLNIFSALITEKKKGGSRLFNAFIHLLRVEERAIEIGYVHEHEFPYEVSLELNYLVDAVIENLYREEAEVEVSVPVKPIRPFTDSQRQNLLRQLNARVPGDELNFLYERNMRALKTIEYHARRYKRSEDRNSLKEIINLLVAASGHDIHEIRNRANIILERVFSPKEFDAPLATHFINCHCGESIQFSFDDSEVPDNAVLRIYRAGGSLPFVEGEIRVEEIPLSYDEGNGVHFCDYTFAEYGHFDYVVASGKGKKKKWVLGKQTSGRVNVIPDVTGSIILEIFTDIHGHTGVYWQSDYEHPGLVYNENGEVIRLGNFADVTAHLPYIKENYSVNAIYLLGVQKRGNNYMDWSAEATSPSPFSPVSLTEIEPSLGGETEFKKLVKRAHELDIKVIVDVVPHINRRSDHLDDSLVVKTYDDKGNLVARASTDGRYGSWNDGKLLNYRKFQVWEWLADSICELIERYDIDGIRFDSAHAVPIMMKKNNYLYVYNSKRTHEDMVEGNIIVNDKEFDHFITTGYYDSECRDFISVPLHYYLMLRVQEIIKKKGRDFFLNIAECYWGHEKFLTRTGLIPYNSALFKICENIIQGKTDVREIYHIYDNYFPSVLPRGTELLGILGNHDERRALNTFGQRGLRAAVALTSFMNNIILDYEGSAEGESWKVFLDNIYVNWNQFEHASHRSLDAFYKNLYSNHRRLRCKGHLLWANNHMVAAAMNNDGENLWIGAFNFSESNQSVSIQFDNPRLPINKDTFYRIVDPLYSKITGHYTFFSGRELRVSRINTVISFTERYKLLRLEEIPPSDYYEEISRDSFYRLCEFDREGDIFSNFVFSECAQHCNDYAEFIEYLQSVLVRIFWEEKRDLVKLGLKRVFFHLSKNDVLSAEQIMDYCRMMSESSRTIISELGTDLLSQFEMGTIVFMSAEAEPFSKSGGLADVVYELPREMVKMGEKVCVITGLYRGGTDKSIEKMQEALQKYNVTYTGVNVRFKIQGHDYEVGVHSGTVDGVTYYLLDHHEFFDGLYWGITSEEKLRRRLAFARSCVEVILSFNIQARFTFTNDAYAGLFNGIVRSDSYYFNHPLLRRNTYLHIIHNGGWQYFDAFERYENERDLFRLFNLPEWRVWDFYDPVFSNRLNCMATGVRFADRVITVSPSYAKQIEYASDGLEHILYNVFGVSNALGSDFSEKLHDKFRRSRFVDSSLGPFMEAIKGDHDLYEKIGARYPEILEDRVSIDEIGDKERYSILWRMRNKLLIQFQRGLAIDPDAILFVMIHRISEQKGFQLLLEASEGIFHDLGFQAILGGPVSSGDNRGGEIAHGLYLLSTYYPDKISVHFGYQDVSVPLLSGDYFGMPSMHEPGGISQLEAFASGCPVIARATGGLRDTVVPLYSQKGFVQGNGFLFSDYTAWSFYDAMKRASDFFHSCDEKSFYQARVNASSSTYFWDRPARQYIEEIYSMTETIRIFPDEKNKNLH